MRKFIVLSLALALALSVSPVLAGVDQTGNGAPSGAHYTLNIIGVSKDKTADMDDNNGHRIFVPLEGKTKINLQEGEDFAVLDANATDGEGAFQLPAPGVDAYVLEDGTEGVDTMSDYSVFIRSLGKPGGWATITTCADIVDSTFGGLLGGKDRKIVNEAGELGGTCSLEQVGQEITMRTKGKSTFTNVTAELTTLVFEVEIDEDGDGVYDETLHVRVPIFDDSLENEYWEYDNHGLKVLQARFYEGVQTDVSVGDDAFLQ